MTAALRFLVACRWSSVWQSTCCIFMLLQ